MFVVSEDSRPIVTFRVELELHFLLHLSNFELTAQLRKKFQLFQLCANQQGQIL